MSSTTSGMKANFITKIIDEDLNQGTDSSRLHFRFPPEPNGFLHIGHAKSICLNFGLTEDYEQSHCTLRFDDTNPCNEEEKYARAIEEDIRWLGFSWDKRLTHASDYFEDMYNCAVALIEKGLAYVCALSQEEFRGYRGDWQNPGKACPSRERSIAENLDLFKRMRAGEFAEGQYTLRAKIDMTAGNINMRDPAIYRIRPVAHQRTGDNWCIYPLYDFAHCLSDAFENISHSLCTLEFQDHRPLYDWFIEHCPVQAKPKQIEFSRLNLTHTITSKRKLKKLVDENFVSSWDDPRMSTLSGIRRRGFTPTAIRHFCTEIGISKQDSVIDFGLLEEAVRSDLNEKAERRMAVLDPIKVIIDNYPEEQTEELTLSNHPQNPEAGSRSLTFSKHLWIDRDDFQEEPEPKFFRLAPGKRVRLRQAYVITCDEVIKDENGVVTALKCHYHPETKGGKKPEDGKKVKGIIHWLSEQDAVPATVRVYDRLFLDANPGSAENIADVINPDSQVVLSQALVEKSCAMVPAETVFQFTRIGYFVADRYDHNASSPVFNRVVPLRQTWQAVKEQQPT